MKTLIAVIGFAMCCGWAASAFADDLDPATPAKDPQQDTFEQTLIKQNIAISHWIDGVADGLDVFLAGERYTKKPNETSATIEASSYYNHFEGYTGALNFNVDLRLPNVEEYWQLTFTSYDENEDRGVRNRFFRQTPRERNYGASVGFFKKLGNVRTAFQPRVSFQGAPAISHSLSFESIAEEKGGYRVNPKLEFYATPGKGAGVFQAINFNFELTRVYSITFINEGDYESRVHFYTVTHGVSLGQRLNRKMSFGYNVLTSFINRPNYQLDTYNFSVAWRHLVYKRILDYEVIPNLDFRQSRHYVGNPGVTFNFNINF